MSIHQGHDDPEIRRQYGDDSARLVCGWDSETEKLFHTSQARRGLSCGLICPHCKGVLVAHLKDDLKAAHFAHHGPACAYSDEAGQRFRSITGHPFRFHSGRDSDLKPATFEHHLGRC